MKSQEIRDQFIQFFKDKKHTFVPSAPVLPAGDATLMFTNAGMNQFKDIFLGERVPEYKRAVNSQKCIRVSGKHNDLEEVGRDTYHHTFFEMLGNWSFGDYYKKEAIVWAWELLTDVWQLPKNKLYATVYKTDQEAFDLWAAETDIAKDHIMYFGDKDNFWMMGDTGPCGPCSEIHIDLGPDCCDRQDDPDHVCAVNSGCARYIELWNLVFIQYNKDEAGNLNELPQKYVDTGAGFERLCAVLQDKKSNYDTDVFMPLIGEIEKELKQYSDKKYYDDERGTPFRVIADHLRMVSFSIADGITPSNEGRGYVVRRVLRRALRFGRDLGFKDIFMYKLVDRLANIMSDIFPELKEKNEYVQKIIESEEKSFSRTLDKGIEIFEDAVTGIKGDVFPGDIAFKLYDTYGFPIDLTQMMAAEKNMTVDIKVFEKLMAEQKERARAGSLNTNKGIGGEVEVASDNEEEKKAMARHHTATHLLHAALQKVLGAHATQAGSLVNPDKLRFDFKHFQAMTDDELKKVEQLVNDEIKKSTDLKIFETKYDEAKEMGAMSLFGEKYGDEVRVVEIPGFSMELCGGTHAENTADLEEFKIIKESSIAAGVRRIEALAGKAVIAGYLKDLDAQAQAEKEKEVQKAAEKEAQKQLLNDTLKKMEEFLAQKETINDKVVLVLNIGKANHDILRTVVNSAVNALGEAVIVLAAEDNGKVALVARVTPELIGDKLNAGVLVKTAAQIVGGGGGGKPDQAQAGGKDPAKIDQALAAVKELIKQS